MKVTLISGIVLLVLGVAMLGYQQFDYTTTEDVLRIGPISASAEQTHVVVLPPIIGWLLVGAGACVLAFAAWSHKK